MFLSAGEEICRDNNWATGTHPHPTSCSLYVVCHSFNTTVHSCQVGQTFDPIRGQCWNASAAAACNDHKTTPSPVTPDNVQCTTTAKGDVLFILDSSSSIGYKNYTIQLQFVANLTRAFTLGRDKVQFSVVVFASFAETVFTFDRYYTHLELEEAIMKAQYVSAGTNTYQALEYARTTAFTSAHGARPDVAHIAIVMTDGESSDKDKTKQEAQLLKGTGVHVLAVGVGAYNRDELDAVATTVQDVFTVGSFDVLGTIEKDITVRTCNEVIHTTCRNFTLADIIFVLDGSSSIGYPDFYKQLLFTANLTKSFRVGANDVRFGALTFGTSVQKLFDLGTYNDHTSLEQAILRASYLSSSTNTGAALSYITSNNMFSTAAGGRDTAPKIIIVLTDGQSTSPTDTRVQAGHIKDRGIHMMSIGVGSQVDQQELVVLSSHPLNIFLAASYEVLHRLQEEVANRTCEIPSEVSQDLWNVCREQNWENGIHAHPFDCTKFIECTFLHTAIMHCPPGLVYDPLKKTCLFKHDALSCRDYNDYHPFPGYTTLQPPQPPTATTDVSHVCRDNNWQTGVHPHPVDCAFYLQCDNYVTHAVRCPDNKVFDPITKSCMDPALAAPCNDHYTSTTSHTQIAWGTTTSPKYGKVSPPPDAFLEHF
ncbi:hypothetical protein Btru_045385 [Bulinus truncatus]|nr:hypothetical protein Btru_045385 [Bulinus truncatus]